MDLGLRDKVAVVTGASTGIGLAVVEGLAAEGAHVVMAARGADRLDAEARRVAGTYGVPTLPVACDVATATGTAELTAATEERFGGADILFNNAGAGSNETIMEAPDEKWGTGPGLLAQSESLLALSNGRIGLRGNLEEGEPFGIPGTYLNGFYEQRPLPYAEAGYGYPEMDQTLIDVTNGKLIRLLVDDAPFGVRYGDLHEHRRRVGPA